PFCLASSSRSSAPPSTLLLSRSLLPAHSPASGFSCLLPSILTLDFSFYIYFAHDNTVSGRWRRYLHRLDAPLCGYYMTCAGCSKRFDVPDVLGEARMCPASR